MTEKGVVGNFIQKIAVLYIIVWSISPPLQIDMIYRLAGLGCVGLWFLVELKHGIFLDRQQLYGICFAIAVVVIAYIEHGSFSAILKQIALFMLAICFLMNRFYEGRWEELRGIILIVLILLIVFNFKTWQVLVDDPTIARKIVRVDEAMNAYMRQGIGGYGLIYPQVCMFPALITWISKASRRNPVCFFLGCTWLVSYVLLILNAGYSIAIFATATGLIMLFFYKGRSAILAFMVMLVIFGLALLAIVYLDGTREFLLEFFDGTAVAKKINDLVASAATGAAEGSIYARMNAYENTFEVIFEYPLIGSLWSRSGGGHSALLDVIAKYGLLGGGVFARMLYHVPNDYKLKFYHPVIWNTSNAVLTVLLFVSILNSFSYSFMAVVLIVLPLLYEDIIRWEAIDA